ncbi:MAG: carboxylesterase/lipase family protein [Lachnospiraceae bacterium]|nr:carboxylesterase/lipase family protein [Lachnospiraceae bacterium]
MLRITETENGKVRGIEAADPRITAFKGIPFAAPPVGKNRWRAPQPAQNWEGIRECYRFAPISIQDTPGLGTDIYCKEWHVDPEIEMSEDCLYLNVWTPAKSKEEKLPVVVWFFGGALQWGYPSEMEFDGERVARRGVVVVSVNYRLAALGFMTHPQIIKEQPDFPANFGNLDQQYGLRWVQKNIANFGGDPKNVTIAGQSAGGGSVLSQIAYQGNKGLFDRGIIQSGIVKSINGSWGLTKPCSLEEAAKKGEEFFELLGVKTLEEARELDALYIRDKYAQYCGNDFSFAGMAKRFMTVQDNVFCCGDPYDAIVSGKALSVPIMAGNTSDEFLEDTQKYGKISPVEWAVKKMAVDRKENGVDMPVYYYCFDPDIPGDDNPGTFHSVELWFFFETLAKCWRPFVGRHYDLARQMCNYWSNFVKTGDPNGCDADKTKMPEWKPYTKDCTCSMIFTSDGAKTVYNDSDSIKELLQQ